MLKFNIQLFADCGSVCTAGCYNYCTVGCADSCTGKCDAGCVAGCKQTCISCTGTCQFECTGGCTGNCTNECKGCTSCSSCSGCTDSCSGCGGSCSNNCSGCSGCTSCSGGCDSGCNKTCKSDCDNACKSLEAASLIAQLGGSIKKGNVILKNDVLEIRKSIRNEIIRRKLSPQNDINLNEKTLLEDSKKAFDDIKLINPSKSINLLKGEVFKASNYDEAIIYVKKLMSENTKNK